MKPDMYELVSANPEAGIETDEAIVFINGLAGVLRDIDGNAGRHLVRAQRLAEETEVDVLACTRLAPSDVEPRKRTYLLGLPKAVDPSEYAVKVAEQAKRLNELTDKRQRVTVLASSAGAGQALAMAESEQLEPSNMMLFDPGMLREQGKYLPAPFPQLFTLGRWAAHQLFSERRRPQHHRSQYPLGPQGESPVSSVDEIAYMGRCFPSGDSGKTLRRFAAREICPDTASQLLLPGATFTQTPSQAMKLKNELNGIARDSEADFEANYRPTLYHSWTDDPDNLVKFYENAKSGTVSTMELPLPASARFPCGDRLEALPEL